MRSATGGSAAAAPSVLLFGAGGWIGGILRREVLPGLGLRCVAARARADDAAAVRDEVARHRPALVLSALGRTHGTHGGRAFGTIDYLEQPGRLPQNLRDNLAAPLVLAAVCRELGTPCAQLATGCIYEAADLERIADDSVPGFREQDAPNFAGSSYSAVKGATDSLLTQLFSDSTLFFRIRMPITHDLHPRSFLTKITTYERVCSVPNSMSVLDGPRGLLRLLVRMALAGKTGCYNATNPGVMSHGEMLELYRARVDPCFRWRSFSLQEQAGVLAAGRSNNRLDTTKREAAAAELGEPLPSLREAVEGVMQALAAAAEPPV